MLEHENRTEEFIASQPADASADESYAVGRGRPPRHTQFRKGQSGNPKGRPRGAKNFGTLLNQALDEKVELTVRGKRRKVSKREVIIAQLVGHSAKADWRALKLLLDMVSDVERRAGVSTEPAALSDADREALQFIRNRRLAG
jgi:hypothetical protein